jgi:CRP-like cAMP-binding protein
MADATIESRFECLAKGLPRKEVDRFSDRLRRSRHAKGEVVLEEGTPSDALRLVLSGDLSVVLAQNGRRVRVGDKKPGDWVGELGFVLPGPAAATVEAASDAELAALSHEDIPWLAEKAPAVLGRILSSVAADLARRIRRSRMGTTREGLASLQALHGVGRAEVDCAWAAAPSPYGARPVVDGERLLATLDHVNAFGLRRGEDTKRARALREDVRSLLPFVRVQMHLHGEPIVREGQRADGLYVILGGAVRVTSGEGGGAFPVDATLAAGETFGEIAFFDEGTRSATCTAEGATVVAILSPTMVKAAMESGEQGVAMGVHLMHWFAEQLVRDARRMNQQLRQALAR